MGKYLRFDRLAVSFIVFVSAGAAFGDLGKFRNTYYYSAFESEYKDLPRDAKIFDMNDQLVAEVATKFKKALNMEGTGLLLDGRVINYIGVKEKDVRFNFTVHPHGRGVGDCPLIPFHTVAVDPTEIALGSIVRIEETVGMELPDGTKHNGLWRAEDVGSAIKKDRVDLYIGRSDHASYLIKGGITHLKALTLTEVTPPAVDSCVDKTPR